MDGFIGDQFFKDDGRGSPVDLFELQKAAVEPRCQQVFEIVFKRFEFGMLAQACQDQLAHTDDSSGTAGRHIQAAEEFLPGRFDRICECAVCVVIRVVCVTAGGGRQRVGVGCEGRIQEKQGAEAFVVIKGEIAIQNLACQCGARSFAMR